MNSVFITGTSTGVGKTGVSLAVCIYLQSLGMKTAYFKPLQSGSYLNPGGDKGGDGEWIQSLVPDGPDIHYSYVFKDPVSPHLASEREQIKIEADKIREDLISHQSQYDYVVVEGSGGIAVPVDYTGTNLMDILDLKSMPSVLAVSPMLGTLNHTLLTYHYMKERGSAPTGIVMAHVTDDLSDIVDNNRMTIEKITGLQCLELNYISEFINSGPLNVKTKNDIALGMNWGWNTWLGL